MHAGMALAARGLFLAHAMAQALGGRYGASHGGLNALCLAPALRFNEAVVPDAISTLAGAMGATDAPSRIEELARLGGFERLRDLGIPDDELGTVAEEAAQRAGARANPREVTATDVEELLRSIW
jgi:alcohol dehydrogenase class IV